MGDEADFIRSYSLAPRLKTPRLAPSPWGEGWGKGAVLKSKRSITQNGRAMHNAAIRAVVVHGVVLGHAVVPERDVVFLPAPANGVLGAGRVSKEQFQDRLAFQV